MTNTLNLSSMTDYTQGIINSLEDELIVIDRDYRVLQANEAFLKRHGRRKGEVIGQYCYDVYHGLPELCHPPRLECPLKSAWETGKPARATHLHIYDVGSERERYLDIIASPILDGRGKVIAVTELMRDVTEAKKMELRIAEAHRSLMALNAIANAVSQSLDLDTILTSALDKTLEIMRVDTGGILLWDEEKQMLCYRVHHGLSTEYIQGVCCRLGEGVDGVVAESGQAVLIEDILKEPRTLQYGLLAADGVRAFASVPLRAKKSILGVFNIASREARKFSAEDVQLLESMAAQIAIAIENAELHRELQRQDAARGELLRQVYSIQEEERRRIARELHDETSQTLAGMVANLEAVAGMLPADCTEVKDRLKQMQSLSIRMLDEIHKLIYELRPTLLDDLGLVAAIRWLVEKNLKSTGMAVCFKVTGLEARLPSIVETTVFRVTQEAISNIVRHARAQTATVNLRFGKNAITVTVRDDGAGFDFREAVSPKDRPRGLGLLGMKERVELINGSFTLKSRPGGGTKITVRIPTDVGGVR